MFHRLSGVDGKRLGDRAYGIEPVTMRTHWQSIHAHICFAADNLKNSFLQETMHDEFAPLPLHYIAISKVLLETCVQKPSSVQEGIADMSCLFLISAPDDVPDSDDVRAYLKSIREARQSKVLSGVEAVNTEHLTVNRQKRRWRGLKVLTVCC